MCDLLGWILSKVAEWVSDGFLTESNNQPTQNQDSVENVEVFHQDYVYMDSGQQYYNQSLTDLGKVIGWIWSKVAEWAPDGFLTESTNQPNPNQDSAQNVEYVCQDYVYMDGGQQCYNLSLQDSGKVIIKCFFMMIIEDIQI